MNITPFPPATMRRAPAVGSGYELITEIEQVPYDGRFAWELDRRCARRAQSGFKLISTFTAPGGGDVVLVFQGAE